MAGVLAATALNAMSVAPAREDTTRTVRTLFISLQSMPMDARCRLAKYAAIRRRREDEAILEILSGA